MSLDSNNPLVEDLVHHLQRIITREDMFKMRRRWNTHHSDEQVERETVAHDRAQYTDFMEAKQFYVKYRDILLKQEATEKQRGFIDMLEELITQDLGCALFEDN